MGNPGYTSSNKRQASLKRVEILLLYGAGIPDWWVDMSLLH
jgi:hypothetical protein